MNEIHAKNGDVANDVDRLLTSYFQSEMPNPWPTWQAPETHTLPRRRSRWLSLTRLAVAASLAGLLAAYLALAGFFPREAPGKMDLNPSHNIGKAPSVPSNP